MHELSKKWLKVEDLNDKEIKFYIRPLTDEEWFALNDDMMAQRSKGRTQPTLAGQREAFNAAVSDWEGLEVPYEDKLKRGEFPCGSRANRMHLIRMVAAHLWTGGFLTDDQLKNS